MQGAPEYAHEYFSQEENVDSSTFQELLGGIRCLKSTVLLCEGTFLVFQVIAQILMGIINRASPRLKLNELAKELIWFGEEHKVTLSVEWVPREQNSLANELSKLITSYD